MNGLTMVETIEAGELGLEKLSTPALERLRDNWTTKAAKYRGDAVALPARREEEAARLIKFAESYMLACDEIQHNLDRRRHG